MNELVTDLKALHEETLNNLKSSKASNTIRAYKSDFKDFGAFCAKHGFKSLPTEPKIVALYLTYLSGKDSKMSTLRRRLVSISIIHKHKGHYLLNREENLLLLPLLLLDELQTNFQFQLFPDYDPKQ